MKAPVYILFLFIYGFAVNNANACGNSYYSASPPYYQHKLILHNLLHANEGATAYWSNGFPPMAFEAEYDDILEKMEKSGWDPKDRWKVTWPELEQALNTNVDYKALSDFAWYELRVGNKDNAIRLLERLYLLHPDEYNILANLGTGYELMGKDREALSFLKKAVAMNPSSHYGSEWIHVRILEQKTAATPDYKKILDLPAGADAKEWKTGTHYRLPVPPDSLLLQLAYQLHERISFVAAPDPVVAQLVKDFADLIVMTHSAKEAKEFYDLALNYDPTVLTKKSSVISDTIQPHSEKALPGAAHRNTPNMRIYAIAGLLALSAMILILLKLRRRKT